MPSNKHEVPITCTHKLNLTLHACALFGIWYINYIYVQVFAKINDQVHVCNFSNNTEFTIKISQPETYLQVSPPKAHYYYIKICNVFERLRFFNKYGLSIQTTGEEPYRVRNEDFLCFPCNFLCSRLTLYRFILGVVYTIQAQKLHPDIL